MKKIIATVLAMVMALALCTTAFAAPDQYDGYLANSTNISAGKLTDDAAKNGSFTLEVYAATKNSDGTGNLEYYMMGGVSGQYFVKTTAPTVNDFAITKAGKTDILFYLHEVDRAPLYEASAKEFTNFGYKCDQFPNTDNKDYYEVTTGANKGNVYVANDAGSIYVLADDAVITLGAEQTLKAHTWAVSASKVENGKIVPTEVTCGVCGTKSTAIYKAGKCPAGTDPIAVPTFENTYEFVLTGATGSTGSTTTTTSPKTFDAGIAMYVGMALTSVAGSAVVIGKKKEF